MFKRITALALALVLAVGLLPAAAAAGREPIVTTSVDQCCSTIRVNTNELNYSRPSYSGKLINITPQRVEDHFRYLDEVYVERHPEAALVVDTGNSRDREMLLTLAETITAGCTTNTEKANAIDRWLARNIIYDVNTSAYASDTFLDRTGNCLSYANLMQFLLRSLGIPAVVGDGWRGDMTTSTVDLFNFEGHAWVFVLLDGEWVLYDPLWISCGTTDRDYMAKNIYFDTIEFITPAYDGENLPPEAYNKAKVYYTDGVWYSYNDGMEYGYGNYTQYVNNQGYNFTTNQDEWETDGPYDGWVYADGRDELSMRRGEVYRDGWICYGDYNEGTHIKLTYAHVNGMQIDGSVMEYDGQKLYMVCNNGYPILASEDDYTIQYGTMTFKPGYVGPFIGKYWGSYFDTPDHFVSWESDNEAVATVDENGILTAVAPGWATIKIQLIREDVWEDTVEYAYLSTTYLDVYISDVTRSPDYTDRPPCAHRFELNGSVNAACESWGYEIHICTLCGAREEIYTVEPLGHDWDGTVCTLCGHTRKTPFDDVVPGSFYEEPVAWAVREGITSGLSATRFGAGAACNRAQVVTFLWNAADCPEPESTDNPFVDVPAGAWFEKPVLWAVEQGITSGTDATHFNPGQSCNRATVVTFLWSAAGRPPVTGTSSFTDVPAGAWYEAPILWARENGITSGVSSTLFGAASICNRAQVVTFLYAAFGK